MIRVADIEQIFQRHGWSYTLTEAGQLVTSFDGVVIVLAIGPGDRVRLGAIAFRASGSERRDMQARASQLATFLAAVNRVETGGRFDFDPALSTVLFSTAVTLVGGAQDDQRLGRAIALTVSAVRAGGPVVRDLVRGRLTLQQALDILARAVADLERDRRRRSA